MSETFDFPAGDTEAVVNSVQWGLITLTRVNPKLYDAAFEADLCRGKSQIEADDGTGGAVPPAALGQHLRSQYRCDVRITLGGGEPDLMFLRGPEPWRRPTPEEVAARAADPADPFVAALRDVCDHIMNSPLTPTDLPRTDKE